MQHRETNARQIRHVNQVHVAIGYPHASLSDPIQRIATRPVDSRRAEYHRAVPTTQVFFALNPRQ